MSKVTHKENSSRNSYKIKSLCSNIYSENIYNISNMVSLSSQVTHQRYCRIKCIDFSKRIKKTKSQQKEVKVLKQNKKA